MYALIYTNDNHDLLAKKFNKSNDYDAFLATLDTKHILYINGNTYPQNVPEQHQKEFPTFLKSMHKQWGGAHYEMLQPQITGIEIFIDEVPVETPKKVRKPRKKKETK